MNALGELWQLLSSAQRRRCIGAQFIAIVMAFSTVASIATIAPFFAVLADPAHKAQTPLLTWCYQRLPAHDTRHLELLLGGGFILLVMTANLVNLAGGYLLQRLALSIGADFQATLFREYLLRPYGFHSATHRAVLAYNVLHETARATKEVLQSLFLLIANAVTGGCIVLLIVLASPGLGTAVLAALALAYAALYLALRRWLQRAGALQSRLFASQSQVVDEGLGAIKELLLGRRQEFFAARFERTNRELTQSGARVDFVARAPRHLLECLAVIALVLLALGGDRPAGANGWLSSLTLLGFALYRLLPTLQQAFASLVKLRSGWASLDSIGPDLARARARPAAATPDPAWRDRPGHYIALEQVSYRYDKARQAAAQGLTLRIAARSAVGIVGRNGSGKSTMVDLLAGLLRPDSGRIVVDGVPIDAGNLDDWQRRIACVPQAVFLLDGTIADNIAFGVEPAARDLPRLARVAAMAQLGSLLDSLPAGLQHRIGQQGVKLSGGQRQRIGIARALYHTASVLILDEATSAQDGLSERELVQMLLGLRERCTVLLIAQRLSTVKVCDLIVEMADGRIEAVGSYEQLLRDSSSFRRLVEIR